jgi:transcription elongation factor Elf1
LLAVLHFQKGNIDNDENFEYEEWDYYHFECPWCGNDIPILWDDLLDSEKQDSIITCNLCELFEKTIHEVLWAKHGWDDL